MVCTPAEAGCLGGGASGPDGGRGVSGLGTASVGVEGVAGGEEKERLETDVVGEDVKDDDGVPEALDDVWIEGIGTTSG